MPWAGTKENLHKLRSRGREKNGRPQRASAAERRQETREQIMGVVLAQPHRNGVESRLQGFALGRLYLTRQIVQSQFDAGERWTKLSIAHMRTVTNSMPRFPSVMAQEFASPSGGHGWEPEPEDIEALKGAYKAMNEALADAGLLRSGNAVMSRLCIMDHDLPPSELGVARETMNRLHKLWS